jgi:hypothetical protein
MVLASLPMTTNQNEEGARMGTTWRKIPAASTARLIHSSKVVDVMFDMVRHFEALDEIANAKADKVIAQWAASTTEAGK